MTVRLLLDLRTVKTCTVYAGEWGHRLPHRQALIIPEYQTFDLLIF